MKRFLKAMVVVVFSVASMFFVMGCDGSSRRVSPGRHYYTPPKPYYHRTHRPTFTPHRSFPGHRPTLTPHRVPSRGSSPSRGRSHR